MDLKVFGGQASKELTQKICDNLGIAPGKCEFTRFSDGEFKVRFGESIRGADVHIVQSTHPPAEHLMELCLLLDAAKRSMGGHGYITAVIPYFGWARQDRKDVSRVPISAKVAAQEIERNGANNVLAVDLHAAQIPGFFNISVDHLYARPVFIDFFKKNFNLENFVVMGPDAGSAKLAEAYAERLDGRPLALAFKTRKSPNQAKILNIVGEVWEKDILIVDDIIDTAGTIINAAAKLKENEAKDIYVFCTHGVLSGDAIVKIEKSSVTKLFITDSIPQKTSSSKIQVISIAPLLAEAIKRSHNNDSVNSLFE